LKPGNVGGGKDPDFWCAFEDGEVVVIGDEPENTIKDRRRPRLLYRGAKESDFTVLKPRAVSLLAVCLTVKSVGEPDAGDRHVRFDEREWETERRPNGLSYRAHSRLYQSGGSLQSSGSSGIGARADMKLMPKVSEFDR
jgi:hypothetical protein